MLAPKPFALCLSRGFFLGSIAELNRVQYAGVMPVAEKESVKIKKVGGARKGAGRPKGTPNKDKAELLDLITSTGCKHPLQGLAEIAKQSHDEGNFDLAVTCYKELAPYVAARRKAVEHTTDSDTNQPIQINIVSAAP